MDWPERMNSAMDYIEDNLTGNIELEKAAKLAFCSEYHFQRIFTLITNIPVMEYVRRRRMSLAAIDLQQNKTKVLDLALKYGYESHSAFTRAFTDGDVSDDFEVIHIPELDWIVFTTKPVTIDAATNAIQDLWKRLGAEWFSQNPEFEYANAPAMELYYHAGKDLFKVEAAIPLVRK